MGNTERLSNAAARELFQNSKGGKKITVEQGVLEKLIQKSKGVVSPAAKVSAPIPAAKPTKAPKRGKFGNIKVADPEGGKAYDSRLEAKHGAEYQGMLERGEIRKLERQKVFTLHAGIKYIADFLITHLDGSLEAIDSKGVETDVFKLKKKLFLVDFPGVKLTIRKAKEAKKKARKKSPRATKKV